MDRLLDRYSTLSEGRFHRKQKLDEDRSPQELARVIARAKQGDSDALRYLYLRFADNVYGYARSIVRDEHEAEDVTQLVFAKLLTALRRYEPRTTPFTSWVLRVAHNAAIDHMRARRPTPCEELRGVDVSGSERFADLRLALDELPLEQRNVILLRFLVGLTPSEVAERLGRSEDAIHGLQHRGRRRLRRELKRIQDEPVMLPLAA